MRMAISALLMALEAAQQTGPDLINLKAVSREDRVLLLRPSVPILGPGVEEITLSNNGKWAFVQQTLDSADGSARTTTIFILDTKTLRIWTAASFDPDKVKHLRVAWLAGGQSGFILTSAVSGSGLDSADQEHTLWTVSTGSRSASKSTIAGDQIGAYPEIYPHPAEPKAVLFGQKVKLGGLAQGGKILSEEFVFQVRSEDGSVLQTQSFPRDAARPSSGHWTNGGATLVLNTKQGDLFQGGLRDMHVVFSLTTGELQLNHGRFQPAARPRPHFYTELQKHAISLGAASTEVTALWLKAFGSSSHPQAMVASDVERAAISADFSFLLYLTHGSLFIRRLESMTTTRYQTLQNEAIRQDAVRKAFDAAYGALIFWRDSGQGFPPKDRFIELVGPLTREEGSLEKFVPLFAGGEVPKGENPGNIQLGYIEAGLGRAYVMLDGSVHWRWSEIF
jgi:hypothetical protein